MNITKIFMAAALLPNAISLHAQNPAAMFAGNPEHNFHVQTGKNLIYDTRQWKFYTGAPVRSTPLVIASNIYFGNAAGVFYALDKKTAKLVWQFQTNSAIHSSAAAAAGKIFFSDNKQLLYALDEKSGRLLWKTELGRKRDYPWRFDYYYSSPTLINDQIIIGSDDGNLYSINQKNGSIKWKFAAKGIIRGSAAVSANTVFVGDTEGAFYAIDLNSGRQKWIYKTLGDSLQNGEYSFDRKAILSSALVSNGKVIFGSRDGKLYCVSTTDGKLIWRMDHEFSWIISTPAIKENILVTGTSDGRFVQGINVQDGKEIWRFNTQLVVWASPLIIDDKVYEGDFDGDLYCLDLKTGKLISQVKFEDQIMSSPVYSDGQLYVGTNDGYLYSLGGHADLRNGSDLKRYVFYDQASKAYFRSSCDTRVKNYLLANGYKLIGPDTIGAVVSNTNDAKQSVIVFASNYFPKSIIEKGQQSQIRNFLDAGGRVVVLGSNPAAFQIEDKTKQAIGFNIPAVDTIFGINLGPNDTRAFGGLFPFSLTEKGKVYGLPPFGISALGVDPSRVDVVFAKNENGQAAVYSKSYRNGGAFVQGWMHAELPVNLDAILKLAEWKLE